MLAQLQMGGHVCTLPLHLRIAGQIHVSSIKNGVCCAKCKASATCNCALCFEGSHISIVA
jgi:hypothetical protein